MKYLHTFINGLCVTGVIIFLLFSRVPLSQAACFNATSLAAIGNTTLSSICTVAADTSEVNDYTTSENSVNAAVTTLTAAVTVNSGTTGTTVLGSGSFSIGLGGSIAIGATKVTIKPSYPVWMTDGDVDGWVGTAWTFAIATVSGKRRLGLMRSASTLDCNDAAYSEANSCYSYGQAWYYGYGQGMGYWSYAYGYSQACFPADTEILMADGTTRSIQDLRPGDQIMSYDQQSGKTVPNTVEGLVMHSVPSGYLILNNTFRINAGYPTWVANKGAWLRAGDIDTGDVLLGPAGEHTTITSMKKVEGTYIGYHLSLSGKAQDTFFAGGVLVRLK